MFAARYYLWSALVSSPVMQVLVGEHWGSRLIDKIERSSVAPYDWAKKNIEVIKSTTTSLVGLVEVDQQACYLKFYLSKSIWQRGSFRLGMGRGSRSFKMADTLLKHGILVPRPLACVLVPRGMILLTEAVSGATDMQTLWERGLIDLNCDAHGCWQMAGTCLGELHKAGFMHGDFKWSNLLFDKSNLFQVDLEAVAALRPGSKKRYRDLARFTLNAEDMGAPKGCYKLFLDAYLNASGQLENTVVAGTMPYLNAMRTHHIKKYGARGHALLELQS